MPACTGKLALRKAFELARGERPSTSGRDPSSTLQGGPMNAAEVAEFRGNPYYAEAVRVRLWDEEGKVPGMSTPPFEHYAPVLQRVIDRHLSGRPAAKA